MIGIRIAMISERGSRRIWLISLRAMNVTLCIVFLARDQVHECFLQTGMAILLGKLLRVADLYYPAAMHDRDPAAELGFIHVVRGHKERGALVGEMVEELPELAP